MTYVCKSSKKGFILGQWTYILGVKMSRVTANSACEPNLEHPGMEETKHVSLLVLNIRIWIYLDKEVSSTLIAGTSLDFGQAKSQVLSRARGTVLEPFFGLHNRSPARYSFLDVPGTAKNPQRSVVRRGRSRSDQTCTTGHQFRASFRIVALTIFK